MDTIAVIGTGNIGSRHLEGLGKLSERTDIHFVDPNEKNRERAKNLFLESSENSGHKLTEHANEKTLPRQLDVAILATTSKFRLQILKNLSKEHSIRHFIIEKFAFQNEEHFSEAINLYQEQPTKMWINLNKRYSEFYNTIQGSTSTLSEGKMVVKGKNWGLICNAIHFIDLYQFLFAVTPEKIDPSGLSREIYESKRAGYSEIDGILKVSACKDRYQLEILCGQQYEDGIRVDINSPSFSASYQEDTGETRVSDKSGVRSGNIPYFFQSKITAGVCESLIRHDTCRLPPLTETMKAHLLFLKGMQNYYKTYHNKELETIPVP